MTTYIEIEKTLERVFSKSIQQQFNELINNNFHKYLNCNNKIDDQISKPSESNYINNLDVLENFNSQSNYYDHINKFSSSYFDFFLSNTNNNNDSKNINVKGKFSLNNELTNDEFLKQNLNNNYIRDKVETNDINTFELLSSLDLDYFNNSNLNNTNFFSNTNFDINSINHTKNAYNSSPFNQDNLVFTDNNHNENSDLNKNKYFINLFSVLENSFKFINKDLASCQLFFNAISFSTINESSELRTIMAYLNQFLDSMINTLLAYKNKFCSKYNNCLETNGISSLLTSDKLLLNEINKSDPGSITDTLSTSSTSAHSSPLSIVSYDRNIDFRANNLSKSNDSNDNKISFDFKISPTLNQKTYKDLLPKDSFAYNFPRAAAFDKISHLKFLASANVVGRLFDYNGEHIRQIQNQFRVKISTSNNRVFYPGTGKQVLLFKGQLVDIMYSLRTVFTMMIPDLLDVTRLTENFSSDVIKFEISIVIPSTTSNKILSSKGAFLQRIQKHTSARTHVTCMRFEIGDIQERLITITGLQSEVEKTIEAISLIIQDDPNRKHYGFLDYPLYTKARKN